MRMEQMFKIFQSHRLRKPYVWLETSNTQGPLLQKLEHHHFFLQYWKGEVQLPQLRTAETFHVKKNTPQNRVSV